MHEPQTHYAEQKKTNSKGYIPNYSFYNVLEEAKSQGQNRSVVAGEEGEGEEEIE